MGKISVKYRAPEVEFGGRKYTIKKSVAEIMALKQIFAATIRHVQDSGGKNRRIIFEAMQCGRELIDAALGEGTLAEIADGKAIRLPRVMEIVNGIATAAGAAYSDYCRREYGGGAGFSLAYVPDGEALPEHVEISGERYAVETDFRKILLVLKAVDDPNLEGFTKDEYLRRHFFKGAAPDGMAGAFAEFVNCGREERESSGRRDFDFEQDAPEIYSAFMQIYGIDLFAVEQLHWWKFSALLDGVCVTDNALSNKIRLRHMDDSEGEKKAGAERAKRNAALKTEVSGSEKALQDELIERLKNGQDISDLLGGR